MATLFLVPIDLNKNEVRNVLAHLLASDPGTPTTGQFWYDTTNNVWKFRNNAATIILGRLDQISAPTASLNLNSQKIVSLADPANPQEAATKNYVDGVAAGGVFWKSPVRAASVGNITVASPGATIDGVSMISGDRVALIAQTTGSENGIYIWNGSATPMTRASDSDTSAEMKSGTAFFVNEGTANADSSWVLTTNDPIILGTTSLTFVQFSGLGQIAAGTGMTKTGNTLNVIGTANRISVLADSVDIDAAYAGQTSIVTLGTITSGTWNGTAIAVANGGTGATTAPVARTNLGATGKFSATIGDGSTTAFSVTQATHGLASNGQMHAEAYDATTGARIFCDITINNTNGTVTFTFSVAPASNAIRYVIIG
jgi:hypothetical protein